MEFVEGDELEIVMNITAPNAEELHKVHYEYSMYKGRVLLQVVSTSIHTGVRLCLKTLGVLRTSSC